MALCHPGVDVMFLTGREPVGLLGVEHRTVPTSSRALGMTVSAPRSQLSVIHGCIKHGLGCLPWSYDGLVCVEIAPPHRRPWGGRIWADMQIRSDQNSIYIARFSYPEAIQSA